EKDLEFSLEIMDRLRPGSRAACLRGYYTPGEVAGVMRLTHACIAMRYHAQVFAHALGVPLVPVAYEEKRTDFIERHGYPLIPITEKTGEQVLHGLSRI